jgi:hypothetical protein
VTSTDANEENGEVKEVGKKRSRPIIEKKLSGTLSRVIKKYTARINMWSNAEKSINAISA